jgi:hypothetical protein
MKMSGYRSLMTMMYPQTQDIFESFTPSREEIKAVHNWGVKNSANPIKVIEPRQKQASTVRKNKKTIST